MDNSIIEEITKLLDKKAEFNDDFIDFSDKRYKPLKIDKKNFNKIREIKTNKNIAFVDGGNAEILKTADLSFQLIRVYCTIYKDNKKIKSKKREFYVLISAVNKEDRIKYKAKIFNDKFLDEDDLLLDSFDETLKTGEHRVDISKTGEIARRLAELKIIDGLISELDSGDIILRDGDLQATVTNEGKYFDTIYKKALEKKVIICGLSKTSSLLTNKGNSAAFLLGNISPPGAWYYYPTVEIENKEHQAEMFFIKLHEKSKHVFRFEVFKNNKFKIDEILALLKDNSKDPVFLGYPYGLIEADRFARIGNYEKEYQKTILSAKIGARLESFSAPLNAHNILDKIG